MGRSNYELRTFKISVLILLSLQATTALKCYQCISLECPQKQLFCDSVKEYILNQLPELYYGYEGQRVSICPPPDEKDPGWEELRRDTKIDCEEVKDDEATCVLGRYRVTTEILDSGKNITSHGTAMGCAKRSCCK
ncbi:hypothetical protein Ocin01_19244 [Orchesella cincta]|uniref:Protein sleepless n=1 Tax=Orchesella cincta TaxID=48709 RepID=A0A1D2M384_ORCCI|nr:hypothetical protein Ocin01_19244 [Orchesella cincta]